MSEPLLRVTNLTMNFKIGGGLLAREAATVHAVDGVSFSVNAGKIALKRIPLEPY